MKKQLAVPLFFLAGVVGLHAGRWNHQRAESQPIAIELTASAAAQVHAVEANCPQKFMCSDGAYGHCPVCGSLGPGEPTCCAVECSSDGCKITELNGKLACEVSGVACTS